MKIQPGRIMYNPVLKQEVRFVSTTGTSRQDALTFELSIPPDAPALYTDHFHAAQEQRAEILSGSARYRIDGEEYAAEVGDRIVYPAGTLHVDPWNTGEDDLRMRIRFTPGWQAEKSFEKVIYLIETGQLPPSGSFNLLQNAMVLHSSGFETYFKGLPVPLQKQLFALLSFLGYVRGYHVDESGAKQIRAARMITGGVLVVLGMAILLALRQSVRYVR